MPNKITWKWLEESFFPLVVADARRVGEDTTGWALDGRAGPGRVFCRLGERDPDTGIRPILTVYRTFVSASEADLVFQGMRWAYARVIDRLAAGDSGE